MDECIFLQRICVGEKKTHLFWRKCQLTRKFGNFQRFDVKKPYFDTASARVSVFFFISGKKLNIQKKSDIYELSPRHNICITPYPPDISFLLLFPVIRPEFPDFLQNMLFFFRLLEHSKHPNKRESSSSCQRSAEKKKWRHQTRRFILQTNFFYRKHGVSLGVFCT